MDAEMKNDRNAQETIERGSGESYRRQKLSDRTPPAGPHAKDDLTDYEKTPGTGSLPDANTRDTDAGTG